MKLNFKTIAAAAIVGTSLIVAVTNEISKNMPSTVVIHEERESYVDAGYYYTEKSTGGTLVITQEAPEEPAETSAATTAALPENEPVPANESETVADTSFAQTTMATPAEAKITVPETVQTTVPTTAQTVVTTTVNTTAAQQTAVEYTEPAEPQGSMVYIASSGKGTKYHRTSTCSNMKDATAVTESDAQARGYTPCKKCY